MSTSFDMAYQKALAAVGGDKKVGGYLKFTSDGIASPWWAAVQSNLRAWRAVPLWGTAKSGIKGSSPEVREMVDRISFSPELMVVATPHRAAKVIAWAKTLPGWREGFVVFEASGEVRGGDYTKSGHAKKPVPFHAGGPLSIESLPVIAEFTHGPEPVRVVVEKNLGGKPMYMVRVRSHANGKWITQGETRRRKDAIETAKNWYPKNGSKQDLGAGPPYEIELGAVGNPDFRQPHDIGLPYHRVQALSIKGAVEKGRTFIGMNGLGGGNWGGRAGFIYDSKGKHVASMSYNGRLWEPGAWPTKEIKLP